MPTTRRAAAAAAAASGMAAPSAGAHATDTQKQQGRDERAVLYDATAEVWLESFGEHVHVGYYPHDDAWRASRSNRGSSKAPPMPPLPWRKTQYRHIDELLAVAGVARCAAAVDLGCGFGGTAAYVAERLGCSAVGVNISPFQVAAAEALARRRGLDAARARFVCFDALSPLLPLPAGGADLVLSVESAAYMPDKAAFVRQLARLAAPGATVVLADFCRGASPKDAAAAAARFRRMDAIFATPGNWHSADDYQRLMADAGLEVVRAADWTRRVRGFWDLSLIELLMPDGVSLAPAALLAALTRSVRLLSCTVRGGPAAVGMTAGFLLGTPAAAVQGGLDNGDVEYRVIVARKK